MPSITVISKKHGTHEIFFDECDRSIVESHIWAIHKKRNKFYASTNIKKQSGKGIKHMHMLFLNAPMIDHIDGNGLNNSRSNLRQCNMTQNAFNRGLNPNNTTGYKGVSFDKKAKKFEAAIQINGKKKFLGYRDNPVDAARLYNQAALNHIGEFAYLNTI